MEDIFLEATRKILEIPNDNSTVRLAYGAGSETGTAPAHNMKKSVCYVTVSPTDDGYGNQHHIHYESSEESELLTEVDEYTEEYSVLFSCYGSDAYDKARKIRDGLYSNICKDYLHQLGLHYVVHSAQLVPAREYIETRWVNRCDLTANFYSAARIERAGAVDYVDKVNVNLAP